MLPLLPGVWAAASLATSLLTSSTLTSAADRATRPHRAPVAAVVAPSAPSILTVEVHPGIELLSIMAYLGKRYPTPPDSRYKAAVWAHFKQFRNHPALDSVRSGPLYPDFTELGLALTGFPSPTLALPDSSSWYETHGRARIQTILRQAIRFAKDTRFAEFRRAHAAEYASWTTAFHRALSQRKALEPVEPFFRDASDPTPPAEVRIYLDPLNNWGAHYMDLSRGFGKANDRAIRFQIGPDGEPRHPDSALGFAIDDFELSVVWHEMGHYFLRPFMEQNSARIASLSRLFDASRDALKRQGITTWTYAFEESVNRAVVAALIHQERGPEAMAKEIKMQVGMGFNLVPELAELIVREYSPNRARYPRFEQFSGRVFELLEKR